MRPDGEDADQEERENQAPNRAVIVLRLLGPCLPQGSLCGSPACGLPRPGRDRLQGVQGLLCRGGRHQAETGQAQVRSS